MSKSEQQHDPHNDPVYDTYPDPPAKALGYEPVTLGVERHQSKAGGADVVFYDEGDDEWYMVDSLHVRNLAYWGSTFEATDLRRRR